MERKIKTKVTELLGICFSIQIPVDTIRKW